MRMESISSTDCSILFLLNGQEAPEDKPDTTGREKEKRKEGGEVREHSVQR
jgi:hypothetical protein